MSIPKMTVIVSDNKSNGAAPQAIEYVSKEEFQDLSNVVQEFVNTVDDVQAAGQFALAQGTEAVQKIEQVDQSLELLMSAVEGAQNATMLPNRMGNLVDSITPRGNNGAFLNIQSATSTFFGWGGYAGYRSSFNRDTIEIYPFDAALIPTQMRVVVRDTGPTGTILGDVTVPLTGLVVNQRKAVTVEFSSVIDTPNPLWVDYFTNGRTALVNVGATAHTGDPNWRAIKYYAGVPTLTPGAGTDGNAIYGISSTFELVVYKANLELTPEFKTKVGEALAEPAQLAKLPLVERTTELVLGTTTNLMPTLGAAGANQYGTALGAGWYAWGKKLTPPAGSLHVVELLPANPITANGKVAAVVKNSAGTTVLSVSYDITASVWNTAFANGKPVYALLQTPVVLDGATKVLIYHHAYGEKISHWSMTGPAEVDAERFFISNAGTVSNWNNATLGTATNQTVYFHLLTAPQAAYKLYAAANPNSSSGPSTSLTDVMGPTDVLLPSQMYVLKAPSEQFSLYHKAICFGRWGESQQLDWAASYGKQLLECWRIEPQEQGVPLGSFTLSLSLLNAQLVNQTTKSVNVTVVDKTTITTPSDALFIGDSITFRGDYVERVVASLTGITSRGTRKVRGVSLEGRGGWKLTGSSVSYWQAGAADGSDSPFMFPVGISGPNYRGNVEFWKRAIQVDNGTITSVSDSATEYAFRGFGTAAKEGGATYQYDANTGYPLTPTVGWVVFDPSKAAGQKFQEWTGAAWSALASQPSTWDFDFTKYLARYAWAFPNGAPRHVFILLGANDFANSAGDPDTTAWISTYETTIQRIQAASASTRVMVGLPSITSDADGTGDLYGAGLNTERMRRNYQLVTKALLDKFDTSAFRTSNVHVTPFGAGIDPEFGYLQSAPVAPNKYVTDAALYIRRNVDGIHPSSTGLQQAGDWIAAIFQATR